MPRPTSPVIYFWVCWHHSNSFRAVKLSVSPPYPRAPKPCWGNKGKLCTIIFTPRRNVAVKWKPDGQEGMASVPSAVLWWWIIFHLKTFLTWSQWNIQGVQTYSKLCMPMFCRGNKVPAYFDRTALCKCSRPITDAVLRWTVSVFLYIYITTEKIQHIYV